MPKLLIAGCGDVGNRIARLALQAGDEVVGIRRDTSALYPGVRGISADLKTGAGLGEVPADCDTLVYAPAGAGRDEQAYRQLYVDGLHRALACLAHVQRVLFTSSTAVYAQDDGQWVDETSPTSPVRFNGKVMLEAEAAALAAPGGQVLRLGGLYGPHRERLLRAVEQRKPCVEHPPCYTNRMHVEDAARAVWHLLSLAPTPHRDPSASSLALSIVLGVDDEPAPEHVVRDWLATRLGVASPPRAPAADGRGQNKRCRNDKLRGSGFTLRFPTFREGYAAVLRARGA